MTKFYKECLLDQRVESIGTLDQQLDYAWSIYTSTKAEHQNFKNNALNFLKSKFATDNLAQITYLMRVKKENPQKIKKFVPSLADLRFKIMPLNLVAEPTPSFRTPPHFTFVNEVNEAIKELNILINKYNKNTEKHKFALLQQIYFKQKKLIDKFSPTIMQDFPEFVTSIHHQLFKDLQIQFKNLEVPRLSRNSAKVNPELLLELLANMAPEKVDQFLEILSKGAEFNISEFQNLYDLEEPDFDKFQQVLAAYSINFIGGHNSQNFQLISKESDTSVVLKVEHRVGLPRNAENHLRERSLQKVLAPIKAQREGRCKDHKGKYILKSLLLTDFYPDSNLINFSKKEQLHPKFMQMALNIYYQMGTILVSTVKDGCAFLDMKNSNWLLDNGKLILADTKSFVFLDDNGDVDLRISKNYWYETLTSYFMNPPELNLESELFSSTYSADKMHAFMLGRNLYQFLTRISSKELNQVIKGKTDFTYPIFTTPEGMQLKELIEELTHPVAAERLSTSQAMKKLQIIEKSSALSHMKEQCQLVLHKIKLYQFGPHDLPLLEFINNKEIEINTAYDTTALEVIHSDLICSLAAMQANPAINAVKDIISKFRKESHFFSTGMKAKASRIENAMSKVPLHERNKINLEESLSGQAVLKELASHRHFFRTSALTATGTINEAKAANSYRLFKSKINSGYATNESYAMTPPAEFG